MDTFMNFMTNTDYDKAKEMVDFNVKANALQGYSPDQVYEKAVDYMVEICCGRKIASLMAYAHKLAYGGEK